MSSIELLPSAWKLWQPVVFGFLAGLGFMLVAPAMDLAGEIIGKFTH